MPVFTTAITGSGGSGVVALSGSTIETEGFISSLGVGNATTIGVAAAVPANYNSILYGPITIGTAGTLTINSDSAVKIIDIENV